MKTEKQNRCPGCSRHCPADHARCKYGQRYFKKMQQTGSNGSPSASESKQHLRKWEKHVQQGGVLWKLLWSSRRIKKALRQKTIAECQLLSALNSEEQVQLGILLEKMTKPLD